MRSMRIQLNQLIHMNWIKLFDTASYEFIFCCYCYIWMKQVTLEVKGETQLVNLSEKLKASGILHKLWIEQPENFPTCLATKPYPKSVVSPFFRKLKLCKWFPSPLSNTSTISRLMNIFLSSTYLDFRCLVLLSCYCSFISLLFYSTLLSEILYQWSVIYFFEPTIFFSVETNLPM